MTATDFVAIGGGIAALLTVLGGGISWLIGTIDKKNADAALAGALAREALASRLQEDITLLRKDIAKLQAEKGLYLRRIYQLEGFIHRLPDIEIPTMDGWPPV